MSDERCRCAHCAVTIPDGYKRHVFEDKAFCAEACIDKYARAECIRRRSWLSLISWATRGLARSYAKSALYSNRMASR